MVNIKIAKSLIEYLSDYVTDARKKKINTLLNQRTRYVTAVLEDVYQSHNTGAVLRSCEGLGVQNVHYVQGRNSLAINKSVAAGSSKWLTIFNYTQPASLGECIGNLRAKGYSIVATSPHASMTLDKLSLDTKKAFLFGTEEEGLTQEAVHLADECIALSMYGFTESFNVSVSVALTLYDVTTRLRGSPIDWKLTEEEQVFLKLDWIRNSVESADALQRRFFHEHPAL